MHRRYTHHNDPPCYHDPTNPKAWAVSAVRRLCFGWTETRSRRTLHQEGRHWLEGGVGVEKARDDPVPVLRTQMQLLLDPVSLFDVDNSSIGNIVDVDAHD